MTDLHTELHDEEELDTEEQLSTADMAAMRRHSARPSSDSKRLRGCVLQFLANWPVTNPVATRRAVVRSSRARQDNNSWRRSVRRRRLL